jgi:hypothetical protein
MMWLIVVINEYPLHPVVHPVEFAVVVVRCCHSDPKDAPNTASTCQLMHNVVVDTFKHLHPVLAMIWWCLWWLIGVQHINRCGMVQLTCSEQLWPVFVIRVVIPHASNSNHHGQATILWFVVVCFFYITSVNSQQFCLLAGQS